jgi:hypothetical protein
MDRAVLHHVLEVPQMVVIEIHQPEQIDGLTQEMQRRGRQAIRVSPALSGRRIS